MESVRGGNVFPFTLADAKHPRSSAVPDNRHD